MNNYLAIDIGASSGRHIVSTNGELKEVYRFETGFYRENGKLYNDVNTLLKNVIEGIKIAFSIFGKITSLSIDTWGVDYVLLNGDKEILPVYAYRDDRTEKIIDEVHSLIPFETLYQKTGIQFMPFNTIYQLYEDKKSGRLDNATDFLLLPEWLTYKLTGIKVHEFTNATTGGMINAYTKQFDEEIIDKLGLPKHLFSNLLPPTTVVGTLKEDIAEYVNGNLNVVLCATHDTASAVEGIPFEENSPYISSGTWSLLGIKVKDAITSLDSMKANYSNEGGVNYTRYQKNIMGMWIINNLKKELMPNASFPEIIELSKNSTFNLFPDVNDNLFMSPVSMKDAFDEWFKNSKEKPTSPGDYFKSAYVGLAHGYKQALNDLKQNTGYEFNKLYIVGGGAKNDYLNGLTEQICKIKVVALPIEATTIGNIKMQMEANK